MFRQANARNALLMYVGKSFDMFAVTRATSLKSIVSIVVEKDEIGTNGFDGAQLLISEIFNF